MNNLFVNIYSLTFKLTGTQRFQSKGQQVVTV